MLKNKTLNPPTKVASRWFARALLTTSIVCLEALGETPKNEPIAAKHRIQWQRRPGTEVTFYLEYENSTRLETLNARGKPIGGKPKRQRPRHLKLDLALKWQRDSGSEAVATLTIRRIRAVELPGWSRHESTEPHLTGKLRFRPGKKRPVQLKWLARTRSKLNTLTGGTSQSREFLAALEEALEDFSRLFPEPAPPPTEGHKWLFNKTFQLEEALQLRAKFELECLETKMFATEKTKPKNSDESKTPAKTFEFPIAVLEGAISQSIPGAAPDLQRAPGLFPGSIKWSQDLERGFPVSLEARKIARIPVPDEKLPTVKTLTHRYTLRIESSRP